MGIVLSPDLILSTFDPAAGMNRIRSTSLLANQRSACIHMDSRYFWVSNLTNATISQLDPTFDPPPVIEATSIAGNPEGLWGDERFLYKIGAAGSVNQIDISTGAVAGTDSISGSFRGLTGDSRYCWTNNLTSGNIEQYDRSEVWSLVGGFTAPADTRDIHFDGRFMWVLTGVAATAGAIRLYDPVTGTQIQSNTIRTLYGIDETSFSITGDGRFLYVLDSN